MKVLQLTGLCETVCADVTKPMCPTDGMLIRVESVGLCGSDIRAYRSGLPEQRYPATLGHEIVGVVAEVGSKVAGSWQVGDVVVPNPTVPCGKCYYCVNNMYDLCENLEVAGTTFAGGFAQYMVLPAAMLTHGQIIRVESGEENDALVLTELLASVIKAQDDLQIGVGETVVIVGSGPIGCLHAQLCKLRGASAVIMVDISRPRLEKCHQFGGTHFIVSSETDPVQAVLTITGGRGADAVIVACPSAEPHQQGLEMLRKEGRLSVFGGLPAGNSLSTMDANLIHYKRLTVKGAFTYSMKEFQLGFDLLRQGRIDTSLITHVLPLSEIRRGIEAVQRGEAIKVVLKPWA